MKLLDGTKIAQEIKNEIAQKAQVIKAEGVPTPHLAAVLIGDSGPSLTYVNAKIKACEEVGFGHSLIHLPDTITETELLQEIDKLNENPEITGFIVQMPLPVHIDSKKILEAIKPEKDVDGFHPNNLGRMAKELPSLWPATPFGITELLKRYKIDTVGKHCVVVGNSDIVGSPMSMLMHRHLRSTVTICHIDTKDLAYHTKQADILIVAVGKPGLITADMVKNGVVVIDVGITRVEDKSKKSGFRLAGDVNFDAVAPKASMITPVPGGVGPMTIAALMLNTLKAAKIMQAATHEV